MSQSVGLRGAADPAARGSKRIACGRKARPLSAIETPEKSGRSTRPQSWGEFSQCHAKYLASDKLNNWRICAGVRTSVCSNPARVQCTTGHSVTQHHKCTAVQVHAFGVHSSAQCTPVHAFGVHCSVRCTPVHAFGVHSSARCTPVRAFGAHGLQCPVRGGQVNHLSQSMQKGPTNLKFAKKC